MKKNGLNNEGVAYDKRGEGEVMDGTGEKRKSQKTGDWTEEQISDTMHRYVS